MEQARFQAVIAAVDLASGPLRNIRNQVIALRNPVLALEGGFRGVAEGVRGMLRASGLNRVGDAAAHAMGQVQGLAGQVTGLLAPLGALGAVSSVGGLMAIVHGAAEAGGALNDLYTRLGAATDAQRSAIGGLRYSAQQTGASNEDVAAGMMRLNRVLAEVRAGDEGTGGLFKRMGIRLTGPDGKPLTAADIVPQLGAAFEKNEDPGLRERMAKALMGKGGGALIPALVEFQENAARLKTFGRVFTRQDISNLDDFGDRWHDLSIAVGGVRNAIGAGLAPILTPLITDLSKWIAANRELVAGEVRGFVTDLAARLGKVDWAAAWKGVQETAAQMRTFVASIGGARTLLIGFAAVVAGPLIAGLAAAAAAFGALGLAVLANPVTAGIAVVAAGAVLIYRNWAPIAKFFGDIWRRLRDGFGPQAAWLRDTVAAAFTGAAGLVKGAWDGIAQVFRGVWKGITDPFVEMWETIRPILRELGLLAEGSGPAEPGAVRPRRGGLNGGGRAEGFYQPSSFAPAPRQELTVRFVDAPPGLRVDPPRPGRDAPLVAVGYAFGSRRFA